MPAQEDANSKWSTRWTKLKGGIKAALGVALYIHPISALVGAGVAAAALVVKKFRDTDPSKGFFTRAKEALAMSTGAAIGSLSSVLGITVVAAAGAAYVGNYEGAVSMGQGAMVGMAVQGVMVPVLSAALVADGCYNAITGKESRVLETAIKVMKGTARFVSAMLGNEDKPEKTKEDDNGQKKPAMREMAAQTDHTNQQGPDEQTRKAAKQAVDGVQVLPATGSNPAPTSKLSVGETTLKK